MFTSKIPRDQPVRLSRGFTLTELLVVIALLIILLSVLLPGVGAIRKKAKEASTHSLMNVIEQASLAFKIDENRLPGYFEFGQVASPTRNPGLLTENENIVLDLAGGIRPGGADGDAGDGVFRFEIDGAESTLVVADAGGENGAGYLDLGQVTVREGEDGSITYQGSDLFRPADERFRTTDATGAAGNTARPIPVIHDYFGTPLLMWTKNPEPGPNPDFADVNSDLVDETSSIPRRALYYWWPNAGILASESQRSSSVIGVDMASGGLSGGIRKAFTNSMYAILGHPSFHTSPDATGFVKPTVGLGDLVVQSAGADSVFLAGEGPQRAAAQNQGGVTEAFYVGHKSPPGTHQKPMSAFDDLVHSGG